MNLWFMLFLFVLGILIMQVATSICARMEYDADHHHALDPTYPFIVSVAFMGIFLSIGSIINIVKRLEEQ